MKTPEELRESLIDDLELLDKDYLIRSLLSFLPQSQLEELKDSIDETIANKRYKKSFSATNTKGVAIAWIIFGVLIASYRYFSM